MNIKKLATLGSTTLALAFSCALLQTPSALGQPPAAGAPKGAGSRSACPARTYRFTDTNEDLPLLPIRLVKVSKDESATHCRAPRCVRG